MASLKNHFGLAEEPFTVLSDPRFLWYSDQHLEAKEKIVYYLVNGLGPVYLVSKFGTGKSSVAKRIFQEMAMNENNLVAFTSIPPYIKTPNSFLTYIMGEFEAPLGRSYIKSLQNFQDFLAQKKKDGVSPILLIDEAENLSKKHSLPVLELIQHLINFSTMNEYLIRIAIFTQPKLQENLDRIPSLVSRLSLVELPPLNRAQTEEMLKFRWIVAGGNEKTFPFEKDAIDEIYKNTKGIPRSIVKLAGLSLVKTHADDKNIVSKSHVVSAWVDSNPKEVKATKQI